MPDYTVVYSNSTGYSLDVLGCACSIVRYCAQLFNTYSNSDDKHCRQDIKRTFSGNEVVADTALDVIICNPVSRRPSTAKTFDNYSFRRFADP